MEKALGLNHLLLLFSCSLQVSAGRCWGKLALLLPAPHLLFEPTKDFGAKGSPLKWQRPLANTDFL